MLRAETGVGSWGEVLHPEAMYPLCGKLWFANREHVLAQVSSGSNFNTGHCGPQSWKRQFYEAYALKNMLFT